VCLGIPALILEIRSERGVPMALCDFGVLLKDVCLAYTPEAVEGDHVIVHAGFSVTRLDEEQASAALAAFRQMSWAAAETPAPSGR
jgi:hydrogenase expression/formation protein HypC